MGFWGKSMGKSPDLRSAEICWDLWNLSNHQEIHFCCWMLLINMINWSTADFRNIEIQPRTLPVGAVAAGSPARRRNAHAQPSASGSVIGVRQIIAIALWGSLHGLRIPLRIPLRIALTLKKTPWNNFDIFINIPWWFQSNQIGNLAYRNLLDSALSTRNVVPMKVQKQEDCQVWNIYIIEPSNFGRKTCWAQLLCWYLSFFS